jgi:hypothetical protein
VPPDALIILSAFFGMSMMFVAPIAAVIGIPLAAWLGRSWLGLKERELDLRQVELTLRLRESRVLPAWVDDRDPVALIAWAKADREIALMEGRLAPRRATAEG